MKTTIRFLFSVVILIVAGVQVAKAEQCKVTDPTGTPLNVRASPNGKILQTIKNGTIVYVEQTDFDSKNRSWAQISQSTQNGRRILGWVFREFINCYSATAKEVTSNNKIRTYSGYLQQIDVGDRGTWITFKNKEGEERSFRIDPYTPLVYFLVAHKGKLLTISYNIIKVVVPNANDNWKMTQVNEDENFLSAKVGSLTNSAWWEQIKKQAVKDANGDVAKANKKLKRDYDALVKKVLIEH